MSWTTFITASAMTGSTDELAVAGPAREELPAALDAPPALAESLAVALLGVVLVDVHAASSSAAGRARNDVRIARSPVEDQRSERPIIPDG
jgi:hypothetical protein